MHHALSTADVASQSVLLVDQDRLQQLAAGMLERDRWPRERLLDYQRDRLHQMVRHAIAQSPYSAPAARRNG
jgi:hypothetical protein